VSGDFNKLEGKVLYLCYFGLREPLVQTQVLPYLRKVRDAGMKISILTFEANPQKKWSEGEVKGEKQKLTDEGIDWHFLTYHKTPSVPATFYDVMNGAFFTWKFIRREKPDIIHARVHVPAVMGAIAKKFVLKKPKLLFDIRGFFPEEYTDAGRWKAGGRIYRTVKRIEKWLLKESDGFVVLTERGREILFPESKESGIDKLGRPVEVIPCCVDLNRFAETNESTRQEWRRKLNIENRRVIIYVGSFGGWYLTKETADFLGIAKKKNEDVFALILTQSDPDGIRPLLLERGFNENDFLITKVLPKEIPFYINSADFAVSFIKPCYSKQASSPTKNAEYFAVGIPAIVNSGVGDTAEMTREDETGIVIDEFNLESYSDSLSKMEVLLGNRLEIAEKCKKSAEKRFDLEKVGGERYRRIYQKLLG
jgi:glycosyltransferase involved in cell wall biosynthesis